MADRLIEAAGGVLWRPASGGSGIEVALVHRPKYDDWSIPKGKLAAHEHPVVGAVREVREETGYIGRPGPALGEIRYLKDGMPKRVRYWTMQACSGRFEPSAEVDQMMWLPPKEARRHLLPDRDQHIVADLGQVGQPTWPCLLIRHASAGERSDWQGDDRERPLDDLGDAQAEALVPLLAAYHVQRVLSADVLRCLETVGPYAEHARLTVESEPLLSEAGFASQPQIALQRLLEILATPFASAVCSQGKALPYLITDACRSLDVEPPADTSVRKGGLTVLHMGPGEPTALVATERFGPIA